tara:strand:- start:710 stop:1936 length:1227 start_codon:yes stop_codon:yes gene_type:complete
VKNYFKLFLVVVVFIFILYSLFNKGNETENTTNDIQQLQPKYIYGILIDSLKVINKTVKDGQTLGQILYANHIDHPVIAEVVNKSKGIFDVRRVNSGKEYTLICKQDSLETLSYLIYQETAKNYIVFDFNDEPKIYRGEKEVVTKLKLSSGIISSSLSESIESQGISPRVSIKLSEIYAWTIDFFKIQEGDAYNVYYENNYIDGKYIGIGRILAAEFTHKGKEFYSFYYKENDNYGEYFDEEGRTLRKAFLKAPLDFYRISSRYSKNRKHPVTGQWKGHFGTDYAAPTGTPIMTTANGTIVTASYTRNNGNYVKVRHNSTYSTQYLHMSKIKKGIKKGVYVKQGDIIGYVGSTGLATGPHVCYRFWKNGKQVDPYKQKLPPGDPISKENRGAYMTVKDSLMTILNSNI